MHSRQSQALARLAHWCRSSSACAMPTQEKDKHKLPELHTSADDAYNVERLPARVRQMARPPYRHWGAVAACTELSDGDSFIVPPEGSVPAAWAQTCARTAARVKHWPGSRNGAEVLPPVLCRHKRKTNTSYQSCTHRQIMLTVWRGAPEAALTRALRVDDILLAARNTARSQWPAMQLHINRSIQMPFPRVCEPAHANITPQHSKSLKRYITTAFHSLQRCLARSKPVCL